MSSTAIIPKKGETLYTQTTIIIDRPLQFDLKLLALKKRTTFSELIRTASKEYLERYAEANKEK